MDDIDILKTQIDCLLKSSQTMLNTLDKMYKIICEQEIRIKAIESKLEPENPGDINTLYQNWDKN